MGLRAVAANKRTLRVIDDEGRLSPREEHSLQIWLQNRKEFRKLEHNTSLLIEFEEPAESKGRFLRALRDQLVHLRQKTIRPFRLSILHLLPGRLRFAVQGADAQRLAAWAQTLPGVRQVEASNSSYTVLIWYDEQQLSAEDLRRKLESSNRAEWPAALPSPNRSAWMKASYDSLILGVCLTGAAPHSVLAVGLTIGLAQPALRAFKALSSGQVSAELLDVTATVAAIAAGQASTAALIVWMVGIGDLLLNLSSDQARIAIARLMRSEPSPAFLLKRDGSTQRVAPTQLRVGDRILIGLGQRIPADGRVLWGVAQVDEKALTGEPMPRSKRRHDNVLAMTVVIEGQIVVRVEQVGHSTEAAQVLQILESAERKPLTLQKQALEWAARLVLPTFATAGLAALLANDSNRALSVLITDFGTGIRIAIPAGALASMSAAARQGILFKGAHYLERIAKSDVVVFDKTGTLTSGLPEISEIIIPRGFNENEVIGLCASAEFRHEHPIARALKRCGELRGLPLASPEIGTETYSVGYGIAVRVNGKHVVIGGARWMSEHGIDCASFASDLERFARKKESVLFAGIDGALAGIFSYSDAIRPESREIVRRLQANGRRRVILLSGDVSGSVDRVAHALGIDEAHGGMLPREKSEYVTRLRNEGRIVAMVGDGINDAPALALADVGISLVGGTDVAVEAADVLLLEGGLTQLSQVFEMAEEAMANVQRSLNLIIYPNALATVLGAFGIISPFLAAALSNGSTIAAVASALSPLLHSRRQISLQSSASILPLVRSPRPAA